MRGQGIAVVRPLYLGDLLCAVPALRALRKACDSAPITLIGLPWASEFARRFAHYVDGFVPFPGWPGIPEREPSRARLCEFYTLHRGRPYDLVLQMHGDGSVMNGFAASVPAAVHAGFAPDEQHCPNPLFTPYPTHDSEWRRPLRLLDHLGMAAEDDSLEFPLDQADRDEASAALDSAGVSSDAYVVMHPGSRSPDRRWPAEAFAAVADALADEVPVVLTGTEAEREVVEAVKTRAKAPVVDLTGRTSLGGMAALVDGARLLVSNDTGVAHVAAAVRTPSAVVFSGSDPARWAHPEERHRALGAGNGAPPPRPDEVIEAARDLLRRAG